MKKILISSLIGAGVVAGGALLYTASQSARDNSILTIEGTNMEGLFQQIVFSGEKCNYSDENGRTFTGETTTEEVEIRCGIGPGDGVTAEQFSCAMSLCQGENNLPNGQVKTGGCSAPTVSWSSDTGSCTVENCITSNGTDLSGSYQVSQEDWISWNNGGADCGTGSTCLAYTCAGAGVSNQSQNNTQPEKEDVPGNQGNSFGTPTQTPTSR